MKSLPRYFLLLVTIIAIIIVIYSLEYQNPKSRPDLTPQEADVIIDMDEDTVENKAKKYEKAKELQNTFGFINTTEFKIQDLIGEKVILIDFWTYSCINCQRTLPYLTAWDEKYRDDGLVIVGVHTPEFEFEKDIDNVITATEKFNVEYPVVLDNDYSTWYAYRNRYWPHKYLIDIDGFIAYDHIGEGAYGETERKIQELLKERMTRLEMQQDLETDIVKIPDAKISKTRSPEIYFGAWRNNAFANGSKLIIEEQSLEPPEKIDLNKLYLVGDWDIQKEYATNTEEDARVIFKYNAQNVYMVANADQDIRLTILRDGKPVIENAGADVFTTTNKNALVIQEDKLYELINEVDGPGQHTLEIIVHTPRVRIFTFTFG